MNLVRFDPFREMAVLHDRVNRVFGNLDRRFEDDVTARGTWSHRSTSSRTISTSSC